MTYLIYIKHIEFSIYVIDYCKKSSKLPPYIYIIECNNPIELLHILYKEYPIFRKKNNNLNLDFLKEKIEAIKLKYEDEYTKEYYKYLEIPLNKDIYFPQM